MLMALKELGDHLVERDESGLAYFLTLDRLSNTKRILCIDFNWDGSSASYRGTHLEDAGNKEKTLYSRGTSRGGDYTPSSMITYNSPERAIDRIFEYGWFAKYSGQDSLVDGIKRAYDENKKQIQDDVKSRYSSLEREDKRGAVLTINIWEDDETGRHIDAFKVFREAVKENVFDGWIRKHGEKSIGFGECSICKGKKEVVGFGFPFPFRSFDKTGFAPSLRQELAWKQLPLCKECSYSLKAAQSFLEENSFSFNIGGNIKYYIIPEFPVAPPDSTTLKNILKGKDEDALNFFSAEEYYTNIILEDLDFALNLIFLFYSQSQSQQIIEKYVEDVSPSWITRLYSEKRTVEAKPLFGEEQLKKVISRKQSGPWGFKTLDGMIRRILPDPQQLYSHKEFALDLVKRILRGEYVSKDTLLDIFSEEIRRRFIAETMRETRFYDSTLAYSLNSFMFLLFLFECGLIRERTGMEESAEVEASNRYDDFFKSYQRAFDKPEKKAAFLEGVLTKWLMNVQYARRNSTPFRSKLHGLRLDSSRLKNLLGEIDDKLEAYELGYRELREKVAEYMLQAEEEGWDTTRDEITYYFTLGLNLSGLFRGG